MPEATRPLRLSDSGWLAVLIEDALLASEAMSRRSPIPKRLSDLDEEVRTALWSRGLLIGQSDESASTPVQGTSEPESAFVLAFRHSLIQGAALLQARASLHNGHSAVRWQLAAAAASLGGDLNVAVVLDDALRQRRLSPDDEQRLLTNAGRAVAVNAYLLGNPVDGFPLHAAVTVIESRAFVRFVAGQGIYGGPLRRRAERLSRQVSRAKVLFFELLSGTFATSTANEKNPKWPQAAARQIRGLSLTSGDARTARNALRSPRPPADLLAPVPPRVRELLVEQLVLAVLMAHRWSEPVQAFVCEAAQAVGLTANQVHLMESRSAAFLLQHERAALALSHAGAETMIENALHAATETMHEAADGIAREIQETGELGVNLARIARGEKLTHAERVQVREQLVDLAKVVPSLAILAAPGGSLLLPLILKFLPWDLRPSAFQTHAPKSPPASVTSAPPPVRMKE